MDVISKAVDGRAQRDHRLERFRCQGRNLQAVEPAPTDAHHTDAAIAPVLGCKPVDHLDRVSVFLGGIFVLHHPFAVTIAAHVNTDTGIAARGKPRMGQRVACAGAIAFAVGQIFKDHRHWNAGFRTPDARRKPRAIGHNDAQIRAFGYAKAAVLRVIHAPKVLCIIDFVNCCICAPMVFAVR